MTVKERLSINHCYTITRSPTLWCWTKPTVLKNGWRFAFWALILETRLPKLKLIHFYVVILLQISSVIETSRFNRPSTFFQRKRVSISCFFHFRPVASGWRQLDGIGVFLPHWLPATRHSHRLKQLRISSLLQETHLQKEHFKQVSPYSTDFGNACSQDSTQGSLVIVGPYPLLSAREGCFK